jgi:hypothetical protein
VGKEQRPAPGARRSERGLGAGVATADDDDIEAFGIFHDDGDRTPRSRGETLQFTAVRVFHVKRVYRNGFT